MHLTSFHAIHAVSDFLQYAKMETIKNWCRFTVLTTEQILQFIKRCKPAIDRKFDCGSEISLQDT